MEHRSALIVDMELTEATGNAERDAALAMLGRQPVMRRRRTVVADKGYDVAGFVADVGQLGFTPHVAPNTTRRRSAIDGRTTRHRGHQAGLGRTLRSLHGVPDVNHVPLPSPHQSGMHDKAHRIIADPHLNLDLVSQFWCDTLGHDKLQ